MPRPSYCPVRRHHVLPLLLVIVVLLSGLPTHNLEAQDMQAGVDLVVGLETSSRYSASSGELISRVDALEFMATTLIRDALHHNPGVQHRLSVVTFAQNGATTLINFDTDPTDSVVEGVGTFGPYTDQDGLIRPNAANQAEQEFAAFQQELNRITTEPGTSVGTDAYLEMVGDIQTEIQRVANSAATREQAVVLITAGVPQESNPVNTINNRVLPEFSRFMNARSLFVYMMPTQNTDFAGNVSRYSNIWTSTGIALQVRTLASIDGSLGGAVEGTRVSSASLMEELYNAVLMPQLELNREIERVISLTPDSSGVYVYDMPLFVSSATFTVFSSQRAEINPVGGQTQATSTATVTTYENPEPGRYTIPLSNAVNGVSVRVRMSSGVLSASDSSTVSQWTELPFNYTITDTRGNVINYAGRTATGQVTFALPNGESWTVSMTSEGQTGRLNGVFVPPKAGIYTPQVNLNYGVANFNGAVASQGTNFTAQPLRLTASPVSAQAFIEYEIQFHLAGLNTSESLAVEPRITLTSKQPDVLYQDVTLAGDGSSYNGTFVFSRPTENLMLDTNVTVDIPTISGTTSVTIPEFASFTGTVRRPLGTLEFPLENPIYVNASIRVNFPENSLPQNVLTAFGLQFCLQASKTQTNETEYIPMANQLPVQGAFTPSTAGRYTLSVTIRETNACQAGGSVITEIDTAELTALPIYAAFLSGDKPVLPEIDQFHPLSAQIGFFYLSGDMPQRILSFSSPLAPQLDIVQPASDSYSAVRGSSSYTISFEAPLSDEPIPFEIAGEVPLYQSETVPSNGALMQIPVKRATFTVDFNVPSQQQFETATIEVALNGANGLTARQLVESFPDAGIQAQAILTVQDAASTQLPALDPVRLTIPTEADTWQGQVPLPLSGIYSVQIELTDNNRQRLAATTPTETQLITATVSPVAFESSVGLEDQPVHSRTQIELEATTSTPVIAVLDTYGLNACAIISQGGAEIFAAEMRPSLSNSNLLTTADFVPRVPGAYRITYELRRRCNDNTAASTYTALNAPARSFSAHPVYLTLLDDSGNIIEAPQVAQFLNAERQLGYAFVVNDEPRIFDGRLELTGIATYEFSMAGERLVPGLNHLVFPAQSQANPVPLTVNALVPADDGTSMPLHFLNTSTNIIMVEVAEATTTTVLESDEGDALQFARGVVRFNMESQEGSSTWTMVDFGRTGGSAEAVITVTRPNQQPFTLSPVTLEPSEDGFEGEFDLPLGGTYTTEIVLKNTSNQQVWRFDGENASLQVTPRDLQVIAPQDMPVFASEQISLAFEEDADTVSDWSTLLARNAIAVCATLNQANPRPMFRTPSDYRLPISYTSPDPVRVTVELRQSNCSGEIIQAFAPQTITVHNLMVGFVDGENKPFVPELQQFVGETLTIGYFYDVNSVPVLYEGTLSPPPSVSVSGVSNASAVAQANNSGYRLTLPAPITSNTLNITFDASINGAYNLQAYPSGAAVSGNTVAISVNPAQVSLSVDPVGESVQFGGAELRMQLSSGVKTAQQIASEFDLDAEAIITLPEVGQTASVQTESLPLDVQGDAFVTLQPFALPVGGTYSVRVDLFLESSRETVLFSETLTGGFTVAPLALYSDDFEQYLEVDQNNNFDLNWVMQDEQVVALSELAFAPTVTWQIFNRENNQAITNLQALTNSSGGYRIIWGSNDEGTYRLAINWEARTPSGSSITQTADHVLTVGNVNTVKVVLAGQPEQYFYTRYVPAIFDLVPLFQPGARRTQDLLFDIRLAADENRDDQLDPEESNAYPFATIFGGEAIGETPAQQETEVTAEPSAAVDTQGIRPEDVFSLSVTQGTTPVDPQSYIVSYLEAPELNGYRLVVSGLPLSETYNFTLTAQSDSAVRGYRFTTPVNVTATLTQSPWTFGYPTIFYGLILAVITGITTYCQVTTRRAHKAEPHLRGYLRLEETSGILVGGDAGWERDLAVRGMNTSIYRREDDTWNFTNVWKIRVSTLEGSDNAVRVELFKRRPFMRAAQQFFQQLRGFNLCSWRDLFAGVPEVVELHADDKSRYADLGDGREFLVYSMTPYSKKKIRKDI